MGADTRILFRLAPCVPGTGLALYSVISLGLQIKWVFYYPYFIGVEPGYQEVRHCPGSHSAGVRGREFVITFVGAPNVDVTDPSL